MAEIDRSEDVRVHYRQVGLELVSEQVVDPVPDFSDEGEFHSVAELVRTWQPVVGGGGVLLGAFDGDTLAGLALLGGEPAPGILQLALLFVSRPYRRRGIASALMDEVERLARAARAGGLYVSSVPSDSAVGFYLSRGFHVTEPLPEPFAMEPEDIHMIEPLGPGVTSAGVEERLQPVGGGATLRLDEGRGHLRYPVEPGRAPFGRGRRAPPLRVDHHREQRHVPR